MLLLSHDCRHKSLVDVKVVVHWIVVLVIWCSWKGGATQAAAVATWALVCAQGYVLVGVAALHSHTAHHLLMCSCLAESVACWLALHCCAPSELMVVQAWSVRSFFTNQCVLWAHLEASAPSEIVACWVFAPSELVASWG